MEPLKAPPMTAGMGADWLPPLVEVDVGAGVVVAPGPVVFAGLVMLILTELDALSRGLPEGDCGPFARI